MIDNSSTVIDPAKDAPSQAGHIWDITSCQRVGQLRRPVAQRPVDHKEIDGFLTLFEVGKQLLFISEVNRPLEVTHFKLLECPGINEKDGLTATLMQPHFSRANHVNSRILADHICLSIFKRLQRLDAIIAALAKSKKEEGHHKHSSQNECTF